jgi:hypothetical protein
VRRSKGEPALAGFFFWEHGYIFSDFSMLEFPLDTGVLRRESADRKARAAAAAAQAAIETTTAPAPEIQPVHPTSAPAAYQAPPVRRRGLMSWVFAIVGLVVIGAGAAAFLLRLPPFADRPEPQPVSSQIPSGQAVPGDIGFQVESRRTDLRITWDQLAEPLKRARIGLLTISDGESKREVPLTAEQLHAGSVSYTPLTSQIDLRLEVFTETGERISEQALAIWVRSGAPPTSTARAAIPDTAQAPQQSPAPAPRIFVAPPLESRIAQRALPALPAPPPISRESSARAPALLSGPQSAAIAPPPAAGPPPAAQAAVTEAVEPTASAPPARSEPAHFVAARPIRRTDPIVHQGIRRTLPADTQVSIRVRVDAAGNVAGVEPMGAQSGVLKVLTPFCISAAKLWRFQPATLGGKPVPSDHIVIFRFPRQR